jgi:hypothetical protein
MGSRIVLVHPPALSPVVWQPLAEVLRDAGHDVVVPDYTGDLAVAASWWERAALTCVHSVDAGGAPGRAGGGGADVVVGYSGSGVLLPRLAVELRPARAVLVDAGVPATSGATVPTEQQRTLAANLLRDHGGDRLPRWTRWWPPEVLPGLLPDDRLRADLDRTSPELPGDFYAEPVPVSPHWEPDRVDYVLLSEPYAEDAATARCRGWTVHELPSDHLAVATRPEQLRDLLFPP